MLHHGDSDSGDSYDVYSARAPKTGDGMCRAFELGTSPTFLSTGDDQRIKQGLKMQRKKNLDGKEPQKESQSEVKKESRTGHARS